MPMNWLPACCAATGSTVMVLPANASSAIATFVEVLIVFLQIRFSVVLIGKRPKPQLLFCNLPQTRQSVRFDDQEKNDQPTEHQELHHGCNPRFQSQVERMACPRQQHLNHDRHQRNESGAQEG